MASAHGPVLAGSMVEEGFGLIRQIARMDAVEQPGEDVLQSMIAAVASLMAPQAA